MEFRVIAKRLFTGRVGRLAFLLGFAYYGLGSFLALMLLTVLSVSLFSILPHANTQGIYTVTVVYVIIWYAVLLITSMSLYVRRWHDLGRNGWLALLMLVPFVNIAVLLYLTLMPGNNFKNEYGKPLRGYDVKIITGLKPPR